MRFCTSATTLKFIRKPSRWMRLPTACLLMKALRRLSWRRPILQWLYLSLPPLSSATGFSAVSPGSFSKESEAPCCFNAASSLA